MAGSSSLFFDLFSIDLHGPMSYTPAVKTYDLLIHFKKGA
jgi:hypothetical protein